MTKERRKKGAEPEQDAFSRILDGASPEKEKQNISPPPKKLKRRGRKAAITAIVLACFALLIFCGLGLGGYFVTASDRNFPNVYLDGIALGSLTKEESALKLEESKWEERVAGELLVKLPAEQSFKLSYVGSGAELSAEKALEAAYDYGRGPNWFKNLFSYFKSYIVPVDVNMAERAMNEDYIRAGMERGITMMDRATAVSAYTVDEEKAEIRMVKGAGHISLDEEALYTAIVQALKSGEQELSADSFVLPIERPDFDKLYEELAVEPEEAYFTETFEIVPEVRGCSFDVAAAKKLWDEAEIGKEIKIALNISVPEKNSEALRLMLYRDKLGGMTTYYKWSSANRIGNIKLAAEKINGLVLMPGDVFSFNETVGQRTEEAGFRSASAYNDGQVVEAIGGGICQVSSTLYCAQMYAQLKTSNRVNHYFKVDYLDYGLDATVSWKNPDYKFTNSREYPVKIVAFTDEENSALTIEIWGTDVDGSYVQLRHTSSPVYDETWTETLIGYTVRAYRDVYDAEGKLINTVNEPGGVYYFHDEDIDWPPEKEKAEKDQLEIAIDVLEEHAQQNRPEDEGGYLFDPDEYLGGYDIYA